MWFKVKYTYDLPVSNDRFVNTMNYYLLDAVNFAEAGYKVMQANDGKGEVEEVSMMKAYKPAGNEPFDANNRLFIVKFAEDFLQDNGKIKTMKYPVPFFANDNTQLQTILDSYMKQGLSDMRVTTVSETKWIYIK